MNEDRDLVHRLARVEQEIRRWKLAAALAGVGFTAVMLMGQAASEPVTKMVEAERFILRDDRGKTLAILGVPTTTPW